MKKIKITKVNSFVQNDETKKFTELVRRLKDSGDIKSISELAIMCDYLPSTLSMVMNGERNAPYKLLNKFCLVFKLDPNFFKTNFKRQNSLNPESKRHIGREPDPPPNSNEIEELKRENRELRQQLMEALKMLNSNMMEVKKKGSRSATGTPH